MDVGGTFLGFDVSPTSNQNPITDGSLTINDATAGVTFTNFQQFRIGFSFKVEAISSDAFAWDSLCTFQLPTYEVKSSGSYGSGTHLFSTAICSPINGPVNVVTPTFLTFKVDPDDCTIDGVRVQYNNLIRSTDNMDSFTGYMDSSNFPVIASHY